LTCGSSTFFALLHRFLLHGGSRGRSPGSPRERSYPYRSSFHDPGPQPEHPSGPCLTGTTTRTRGLGRSPPRPRPGITCEWAYNRKEQYRDNKSSTMINDVNPNAPPRGHTLLSFCVGEKKVKNKSRQSTSRAGPLGRLEPPPELRRTPSRASPGRDGGQTRCRPPSRRDGVEADRGRC